jgi:hypothetical protein
MSDRPSSDDDVAELAGLLRETAEQHDQFEQAAPKHDWWDWYAPYLRARLDGKTQAAANDAADQYMVKAHNIARR